MVYDGSGASSLAPLFLHIAQVSYLLSGPCGNCLVHDPPVAVNDMLLEPARVAKKVCNDINIFQTKVRQLVNVAILKFF